MGVAKTMLATMAVLTTTMACSTPLSLRGARVMEPGELEVIVSPQMNVDVLATLARSEQRVDRMFAPELSARFGVADRVDLQLRVDKSILPEISAGYQLVGDPSRDDDLAVTVTGGLKLSWLLYGPAFFVSVPVQLLTEIPLNHVIAVVGGLRVVAGAGTDRGGLVFAVSPGLTAGVRCSIGPFVISPELGVATAHASDDLSVSFLGSNVVPRPLLAASVFDFQTLPSKRDR